MNRLGPWQRWLGAAGSSPQVGNGPRRGMRRVVLVALSHKLASGNPSSGNPRKELMRSPFLPGSADAANPGTIVDGENAACSISAK